MIVAITRCIEKRKNEQENKREEETKKQYKGSTI